MYQHQLQNNHVTTQEINSITENSKICIEDLDTGEEFAFSFVPPEKMDSHNSKISILTPIGRALSGHKAGDVIRWQSPIRLREFKVIAVW